MMERIGNLGGRWPGTSTDSTIVAMVVGWFKSEKIGSELEEWVCSIGEDSPNCAQHVQDLDLDLG